MEQATQKGRNSMETADTTRIVNSLVHRARDMRSLDTEELNQEAEVLCQLAAKMAAPLSGMEVTVIPVVNYAIGESRDTEPGCQPWTAEFVGVTPTQGQFMVMEVGRANP